MIWFPHLLKWLGFLIRVTYPVVEISKTEPWTSKESVGSRFFVASLPLGGLWFPAVLREGSKAISWKTNGAVLAWGRWMMRNSNLLSVFCGSVDIYVWVCTFHQRHMLTYVWLFSHGFRYVYPGDTSRSWCTWYWQPGVLCKTLGSPFRPLIDVIAIHSIFDTRL